MLEKYGVAKLPPLRIAAETKPAIYIANYDLLVWRPRPSLYTIYSNIDKYLNES
jgi:hypothetical protein